MRQARHYDMKDFLPTAYEVEKRPKASKPSEVNKARTKKCNNIGESSSLDTVSDDGGEGMNFDDDDDSHGTSNYPLQSEPLLEMPICEPSPISTKKTPVASSSKKPMG